MKYNILLTILLGTLFPSTVNSQQSRSTTRAVIIGISDYQNQDIPDLQFAHKDAAAFADYLKSPAGGSLTDEQLKLLLNENATLAQIAAALEWLMEMSQEGDQAIIYFSGHGDVENKTMFQLGYLLTWDSPARTYVVGAFPLSYLQAVVSTLSLQKKVEVALITDACRAGKLAGTNVGGAQITNANLSKQFANEVKILSCQPDEFSLEGRQWGGGRGVFSYHLLDGLYGMADNNEDLKVNLFEIGRYLEDKVSNETDPHSQFPMVVGSKNTTVAVVNETALASLKEKRSKEMPTLELVESKGFEDMILTEVDSIWQKKYREFIAAVGAGRLLDSPTDEAAAYDLYVELSQAAELKKLHGTMQRNLAAALQDDAQQAINAYLQANPSELQKRYDAEQDYGRHTRYLKKAAEILGEKNFYYPFLMAKLYYFEGLKLRLDADTRGNSGGWQLAIEQQLKAIEYQPHSPYVLNELGVLHTRLKLDEEAFEYYEKAIEIAPEWGLPYVNYSVGLYYAGQQEQAINYGELALKRMPDYPQVYNFLGWIYANYLEFKERDKLERTGLELENDFVYGFDDWGTNAQKRNRFRRTTELLEQALQLDSSYHSAMVNLGNVYLNTQRNNEAVLTLENASRLNSKHLPGHILLCWAYIKKNEHEKGNNTIDHLLDLSQGIDTVTMAEAYCMRGIIFSEDNQFTQALEQYEKALEVDPGNSTAHEFLAGIYKNRLGNFAKAEAFYLKMLETQSNPTIYQAMGRMYQTMGQSDKAEKAYLEAIEKNPDYVIALTNLARYYVEQNRLEEAEEAFKLAVERFPSAREYDWLGYFYYKHEKDEDAIKYLNKALSLDSTIYYINTYLSSIYYKNNDYKKAWDYMEKFVHNSPTSSRIKHFMDIHNLFQNPPKRFENLLKKRLELAPHHRRPYTDLAYWYKNTGQVEKAEQVYKNFLALHPESLSARDYLLHHYWELKQVEKVIAFLKEKQKENPENHEVAIQLSNQLLWNNRYTEAKKFCPDEIKTDRSSMVKMAAEVYYRLGEYDKANRYFEHYAKSFHNNYWPYLQVGWYYYHHGDGELSELYFLQAIETSKRLKIPYDWFGQAYHDLAWMYFTTGKKEEAVKWLDKGTQWDSTVMAPQVLKAIFAFHTDPKENVKPYYEKLNTKIDGFMEIWVLQEHMQNNEFEKADKSFTRVQEKIDQWWVNFLRVFYMQMKIRQKDYKTALHLLESMELHYLSYYYMTNDPHILQLKDEPIYQNLLRSRFPEKFYK